MRISCVSVEAFGDLVGDLGSFQEVSGEGFDGGPAGEACVSR